MILLDTDKLIPKELKPFKNLIYCPLKLPAVPKIDEDRLLEFISMRIERDKLNNDSIIFSSKTEVLPAGTITADNNMAWSTATNRYPWNLVTIKSETAPATIDIYQEFTEWFPEFGDYLNKLPITLANVTLLNQKENTDVALHTDSDKLFGIRIYLINRSNARIFFRKIRNPMNYKNVDIINRDKNSKPGDRVSWDTVAHTEQIYGKYPEKCFPFHLSSSHAAHGVEAVPSGPDGARVTAFIIGHVDPARYAKLLTQSLETYKDYAIWW